MKNSYTSEEFKNAIKHGELHFDKKGKIREQQLLPAFKSMIEKEKSISIDKKNKVTKENKKVRNATKIVWEGIKFDSKVELKFYQFLKTLKIPFEFQKTFVLQDSFILNNKKIREITWTPDFFFNDYNFVADTKGVSTQQVVLRQKMFMYRYRMEALFIKNEKEFSKIFKIIKL